MKLRNTYEGDDDVIQQQKLNKTKHNENIWVDGYVRLRERESNKKKVLCTFAIMINFLPFTSADQPRIIAHQIYSWLHTQHMIIMTI